VFGPSYEYRRQFSLFAAFTETLKLPSGVYVGNAKLATPASIGRPLHFFTEMGLGTSFGGTDTAVVDPRRGGITERLQMSPSTPGRFWVADELSYVVTQYDTAGRRLRRVERIADWFPPSPGRIVLPTPTLPPYSRVLAIREDRAGLLWVFTAVADPKWAEGLGPPGASADGPTGHAWESIELMWDTQIEVIDTRANRLVSALRLPEVVLASLSDDKIAILRDRDGEPFVDILQVRLITSTREKE
jgi:hypothetical protein